MATVQRRHIQIRGIVQGVGFRPFVYHLAASLDLGGFVKNTAEGVKIEVEGEEPRIASFLDRLTKEAPPFAQIDDVCVMEMPPTGERDFTIGESVDDPAAAGLVLPDMAACADCVRDFTDPANRRFGYPFTNCTNCGPRYTIIHALPYDRPMTTMRVFPMCGACQAEYHDPSNRRFHAQPNACAECGPRLSLAAAPASHAPSPLAGVGQQDNLALIRRARRLLASGGILAIKGLGGFHLACDARNAEAVRTLRARKKRSDKPFALMARDLEAVRGVCDVSDADACQLTGAARPIVILPRRADAALPEEIAPGNRTLGMMLPYTPLHYLLFGDRQDEPPPYDALVMTSGNLSEEPIVTSNAEAWERLAAVADWFLFHNRDIYMRADDSVLRTFEGTPRLLRRSRSYAPRAIDLGVPVAPLLACGGELKNTFCLTRNRYALLSQHIGDLENYETLVFFRETLENMKKLFRIEPRAVAHDLHPLYLSTRLAREMEGVEKIGVQHHHAHIAACMAENGLSGRVIGVALDGTGYGADGKIWGGEFLVAGYAGFERRAHLRYVPLPGGDTAIRQPWRSALAHLHNALPARSWNGYWPAVPAKNLALVGAMIERGVNCVDTSSCGRLFDAAAALARVRTEVNFEGQAAIELETIADPAVEDAYRFQVLDGEPRQLDFAPAIRQIVEDVDRGVPAAVISARFHNAVAAAIIQVCRAIGASSGLQRVCLSGGTFQNMLLLRRAVRGLRAAGFEVFLHAQVPPNDGCIALGQAVVANARLQRNQRG